MKNKHLPVLVNEISQTFDYLRKKSSSIFVDGTIGLGGHSLAIALKITNSKSQITILGFDKDPAALRIAESNLRKIKAEYQLFHSAFENMVPVLAEAGIENVDGILFDLGVSSMQLDSRARGFSFKSDAPLDMRMDPHQDITAAEIINSYPEDRLVKLFREYGEERFSGRIAHEIDENRNRQMILTTFELVDIILNAVPKKFQFKKTHPATNVFRALRMEVNQEVSRLGQGLEDCIKILTPSSRLAVISFHSIEDRIVKKTFSELANPCVCPPKQPFCVCGLKPKIKILKKVVPSEEEILENPRSRSAILRIVEKLES